MEHLIVAGTKINPGQSIVITGRPGTGKTLMGKRFANAAISSGAKSMAVVGSKDAAAYSQSAEIAISESEVLELLSRAATQYGHVLVVIDVEELSPAAEEILAAAQVRSNVTIARTFNKLGRDSEHARRADHVFASGVHLSLVSPEEAFKAAVSWERAAHSNWQLGHWDVKANIYNIIDL